MGKWAQRLLGMLLLLGVSLLFYDWWFKPDVPEVLQEGIRLQVDTTDETVVSGAPPTLTLTSLPETDTTPAQTSPPLALTSLDNRQPSTTSNQTALPPPPPVTTHEVAVEEVAKSAWLQVGSFAERDNAQKMLQQMQAQGWAAEVAQAVVKGKTYHRVFVGPLAPKDVNTYLGKLSKMGIGAREVTR